MSFDPGAVAFCITLFYAGYALGHSNASKRATRGAWKPDPSITDDAIQAEIRAGRKIEAIKLYRQRDGSELKEARQAVEAMIAADPNSRRR